jgi:AraC family transcriptional regulator
MDTYVLNYPITKSTKRNRANIENVIHSIKSDLTYPWTLGELSDIAHLSLYHFNRIFKRQTGVPPLQFLYALRLESAKQMIISTQMSITDVCYAVGYNSIGSFTKRFSDLVGLSPKRLRHVFGQFTIDSFSQQAAELAAVTHNNSVQSPGVHKLSGIIENPRSQNHITIVGRFPSSIPQGEPHCCTLVDNNGHFNLFSYSPILNTYFFCICLDIEKSSEHIFMYKDSLRGRNNGINSHQINESEYNTRITLEKPRLLDPPILTVSPLLFFETNKNM